MKTPVALPLHVPPFSPQVIHDRKCRVVVGFRAPGKGIPDKEREKLIAHMVAAANAIGPAMLLTAHSLLALKRSGYEVPPMLIKWARAERDANPREGGMARILLEAFSPLGRAGLVEVDPDRLADECASIDAQTSRSRESASVAGSPLANYLREMLRPLAAEGDGSEIKVHRIERGVSITLPSGLTITLPSGLTITAPDESKS